MLQDDPAHPKPVALPSCLDRKDNTKLKLYKLEIYELVGNRCIEYIQRTDDREKGNTAVSVLEIYSSV